MTFNGLLLPTCYGTEVTSITIMAWAGKMQMTFPAKQVRST